MASPKGLINRINYDATTGCWNWIGIRHKKGYGLTKYKGRRMGAHRLAAILWLKLDFNSPLHVLHKCDNPPCFNPKHLFLGTNRDNQLDSVAKGRHASTRKTHCRNGHAYVPENIYFIDNGKERRCKKCSQIREKKRIRIRRKVRVLVRDSHLQDTDK